MPHNRKEPLVKDYQHGDIVESAKRSLTGVAWVNFCYGRLESFCKKYEEGKKFALLEAIDFCAQAEIKIPGWAAKGYTEVFRQINDLEFKSLDDAFGVTRPKGKQIYAAHMKKKYQLTVYLEVLQASKDGLSIRYGPNGAYEAVGNKYTLTESVVSNYYNEANKIMKKVKRGLKNYK